MHRIVDDLGDSELPNTDEDEDVMFDRDAAPAQSSAADMNGRRRAAAANKNVRQQRTAAAS